MAALVKQLLEADGFLHNVQSLPSFRRVQELQFQKLKDYMNKKTIDDQSFAESSHAVEKWNILINSKSSNSSNALWMRMTGLWAQRKTRSSKTTSTCLSCLPQNCGRRCIHKQRWRNACFLFARGWLAYRLEEPIRSISWCHYCFMYIIGLTNYHQEEAWLKIIWNWNGWRKILEG